MKTKLKSQRLMKFYENVDSSEVKSEHYFEYDFSKKYLKNKSLLNIGSWTGPFEVLVNGTAKNITAVDIEEKALRVLKKNLPHVKTVVASAEKLPLKSNSFDIVTLWAVIEHIPVGYELATLLEANRVLKPGGYIFITTMSKSFLSNILDPAYFTVGHRHYTDTQLEDMLKDAGFKTEHIFVNGSFITAFHAWAFYFFKYIFRRNMPELSFIENAFKKDYYSKGFYQVSLRARKL